MFARKVFGLSDNDEKLIWGLPSSYSPKVYTTLLEPNITEIEGDIEIRKIHGRKAVKRVLRRSQVSSYVFVDDSYNKWEKPVEAILEQYKYLLELKYNWDDNGAEIITNRVYSITTQFAVNYHNFLKRNFNAEIELPEISAVPDGSLDLLWSIEGKARMLININGHIAKYYGDEFKDTNSISGEVELTKVQNFLAAWMTKLVV